MKKVILYSVGNSVYCDLVRGFFKKNNIIFEEKRVDTDQNNMNELLKIAPEDGVPAIVIDGKLYKHFDEVELKKIFKIAN